MTLEDFKKSINFRSIEKCCATCRYCFVNAAGDCFCRFPGITDISDKAVFDGYGWKMEVETYNVCDKWEAVKP